MRITKSGEKLVLSFEYRPHVVAAVREIDGRQWDAKKKEWSVPVENAVDMWKTLQPLGFEASPMVLEEIARQEKIYTDVMTMKTTDAVYEGALPLHDFQRVGANFLKQLPSSLLADVPGLGKTLQVIAAREGEDGQALVFVPASLKFNWHDEILKWKPDEKVLVIHGDKQERLEQWTYALQGMPRGNSRQFPRWVIANYELLIHDFEHIVSDKEWGAIICDEADRISNRNSKTAKALKHLRAKKRIAMTGTPIQNSPEDLWSIVDWLRPRYLGAFPQFQKKYCVIHEGSTRGGQSYTRIIGHQNLDELKKKMEPIMLRRLKEDVLKDFPAKTIERVSFELSSGERALYEAVRKLIIKEIKELADVDTRTLGIVPVKMLRLKQVTDHSRLIDAHHGAYIPSSKLDILKEMLVPIVASGEKALIFTQFSTMAHIMWEKLPQEWGVQVIWGGVDAAERKAIADEFNSNPDKKILIMTEAGTYGLNLQAATYVFHYDLPWSVSKLEQREGRAHRIGQDKPVTVYNLIAKDTIDEYVEKVLYSKRETSGDVLGDSEGLTKKDIESILGEELGVE